MLGIKNIEYKNKNGIFQINIKDRTLCYMNIKQEISQNTIFNYLERLFRIIDTWQEEYSNANIIGSDNWQLLIDYTDGRRKKYSGYSNLPSNFEAFQRLNQDLVKGVI